MILFKELFYQNFKSTGNAGVKISLSSHHSTLIAGKTGHGKSTIISALCFGLFGRDYGELNKAQLINSINKKALLVEVSFSVGVKSYLIRRGIKPNLFEIFEDDKLLNQDSNVKDYQRILESQILGMNFMAFTQACIIGGSDYVPFMKLDAKDRRDFIEELLGIKIFSSMNLVVKDWLKSTKSELSTINVSISSVKDKIELQKSFIKKFEDERAVNSGRILASINECKDRIKIQLESYKVMQEKIQAEKEVASSLSSFSEELMALQMSSSDISRSIKYEQKIVDNFSSLSSCPTCKQDVSSSHVEHLCEGSLSKISSLQAQFSDMTETITILTQKVACYNDKLKEIQTLETQAIATKQGILAENKTVKLAEEQLALSSSSTDMSVEYDKLKEFNHDLQRLLESKKSNTESIAYYEFLVSSLTDSGIKAKIIKQYVPTINRLINKYLSDMDFFVSFHLDEEFKETVKSRYRDTFRYANFSDGQKARIDCALMFAFRDIAKMRNSVSSNLLILDEVDKSLDMESSLILHDMLMKMGGINVLTISHKAASIIDTYDRSFTMNLVDNFTVMNDA